MKLTVLGCGTIVQKGNGSNCSGYLLDNRLLFDCGPGIWRAVYQHHLPLAKINHIFLTHFHIDHVSDLAPILLNRYLLGELKEKRLMIHGPAGIKLWFKKFKSLIGEWVNDMAIDIIEMGEKPSQIAGYLIRTRPTGHTTNSICYRVEKDGSSFFYSGDTDYNLNTITLAKFCDLALVEASNSTETKIDGHLTPQLAIKLAREADVHKLVLTHMYPEVKNEHKGRYFSDEFKGEIVIARDGMEITV